MKYLERGEANRRNRNVYLKKIMNCDDSKKENERRWYLVKRVSGRREEWGELAQRKKTLMNAKNEKEEK